jgi:hypothetical protein
MCVKLARIFRLDALLGETRPDESKIEPLPVGEAM